MNFGLNTFPKGLGDLVLWLVPIGVGFDWWFDESDLPGYGRNKQWYIVPVGQDIEQAQYPRLYAKWCKNGVHKYGAGSTTTSTKAPDKRGRVSVGKDDMGGTAASRVTSGASGIAGNTLGATGGAETVSLAAGNHASHVHPITMIQNSVSGSDSRPAGSNPGGALTGTTDAQGSGTAHQNMQPSIVCNYIIRAG